MLLFVTIVHFIVAALLIVFVLLQDSKGGGVFGMGATGGGQVFSATGAANFFVKATRALAILFAITCVTLTYMTTHKTGSVLDTVAPTAATPASAPAEPAATPAEAPATTTTETPATPATENK
jgi:preprotein translocase subunit SecG